MISKGHSEPLAADDDPISFERWLAFVGVVDAAAWTESSALYAVWRAWCTQAGVRPGRVGEFPARMRAAGVAHVRRKNGRGYRFRFLTVEQVKAEVDTAVRARLRANEARDQEKLKVQIAAQWAAQRRAGGLLVRGHATGADFGVPAGAAARWMNLALMTAAEFGATVRDRQAKAAAILQRAAQGPRTRMVLSPWRISADGTMTRELTAVDAGG